VSTDEKERETNYCDISRSRTTVVSAIPVVLFDCEFWCVTVTDKYRIREKFVIL
jgi:hypothetical protein